LRNKAALPASLPSAEISRQRLQERLTEIWLQVQKYRDIREEEIEEQEADVSATATQPVKSGALPNNESQMYWQTYAAGPVQVVIEEEAIGELIVKLMGQHVFRVAEKNWARI
jgi:hypothetical protein